MEAISQLAAGLAQNPTTWMLALSLVAVGFLYKARSDDAKLFIEQILKQEAAHRETLLKVIPVAEKLTDSVVVLERLMAKE